jgi:hypothetical protein
MPVIIFKVAVAAAMAALGAWIAGQKALETWSDRSFLWRAIGLHLAVTLGLFVAFYVVGRQRVTSDVPGYYLPAAHAVLAGQLPFRDFGLSYAPLFPYVGAALVRLWDSGKVFVLFDILLSALALAFWHSTATATLERKVARQSTVLYATSGHLIIQVLLGTNQAWIATALSASAMLIARGRSAHSGLVQAMAVGTTKILVLLFWPVLWIFAPRRLLWCAAAVLPGAAAYGLFALAGGNPLEALRREGGLISSGNLPYLLDPLFAASGGVRSYLIDLFALGAIATTIAWIYLRARLFPPQTRRQLLLASLALTGLVFMLVSKKSFTGYAVFFLYPAIAVLGARVASLRARCGFLLLFNTLLVAEPGFWFYLGVYNPPLSVLLHAGRTAEVYSFILLDLTLIACYGYLAYLSARCIQRTADGEITSRKDIQSSTARSLV